MQKSKIAQFMESGTSTWKDKQLTKYSMKMENGDSGTYTTGFGDNDKAPEVGDELEYDLVDKGFGNEIKPKFESKGGGFKAKAWTPEQVAQQDSIKLTCSALESGLLKLEDYKVFFGDCKQFMISQAAAPVVEDSKEADKLPF